MNLNFNKWARIIIYGLGIPALLLGAYISGKECFYTPEIVPHRRHIECEDDPNEDLFDKHIREKEEKNKKEDKQKKKNVYYNKHKEINLLENYI
jgi:hypothetical protein